MKTNKPTFHSRRGLLISKMMFFGIGHAVNEAAHNWIFRLEDFLWSPSSVNFAVVQHHNALAEAAGAAHIVSDDDGGDIQAVPHAQDKLVDAVGDNRVETGGRFIVEDDLGLINDGASKAHAFAHAAGQFGGLFVFGSREIHHFEDF